MKRYEALVIACVGAAIGMGLLGVCQLLERIAIALEAFQGGCQ